MYMLYREDCKKKNLIPVKHHMYAHRGEALIPIKRPSGDDESAFVCRKGFHAINVQAVCDAKLQKYQCSERFSSSYRYACRPWLLTPVGAATTWPQHRYNTAHMKTRNTIERAFGVLKSRFRCLHKSSGSLQFTPKKCAQIIMVAFKLHTFCIESRLANPPALEEETVPEINYTYQGPLNDGHRMRKELIQNKFA
ncbi:putative nuclease HARBI1 [Haliotis rufescens]|uniref:putative nuclease HARBI1 n=1 Tax=Haliotis rufescens TaxID=6454 RepID=UPI00201EBD98|nr:putative nuclease HARBI1 [Haliotis rufescens]